MTSLHASGVIESLTHSRPGRPTFRPARVSNRSKVDGPFPSSYRDQHRRAYLRRCPLICRGLVRPVTARRAFAQPSESAAVVDAGPEYYRERILSMWGALCTAARHKPDSFFCAYWGRTLVRLGASYVASRDGR